MNNIKMSIVTNRAEVIPEIIRVSLDNRLVEGYLLDHAVIEVWRLYSLKIAVGIIIESGILIS